MVEIQNDVWLLKEAKGLVETNIWKARNFLITARLLCPTSLKLRLLEYKMELAEENVLTCSKLLKDMFDDFSSHSELWIEVIPLVQDIQKSADSVQKEIFHSLPPKTQQKMITNCAEFNPCFLDQCQLYLLLIELFPETAPEYGLNLAERLVLKEKESEVDTGACNPYRKILVRQLLPLLCKNKDISVSPKQYYKWLQKSIEHYTCSYTSSDVLEDNKKSWGQLTLLLSLIGQQISWKTSKSTTMTPEESISYLQQLKKHSNDKEKDSIVRKQIFYSSIALLLETACKYMRTLDPAIYIDHASDTPAYIILPNAVKSAAMQASGDLPRNSKLNEYFYVATECLNLLNGDDGFEKDFNLLTRRWKVDKWTWYQLFLANVAIFEEEYHLALTSLSVLLQRLNDDTCTIQYKQRVYCHLAMVNFSFIATENAQSACDYACKFISMFSKQDISTEEQVYCSLSSGSSKAQIYPLSLTCILPVFIDNFIQSMKDSPKFLDGDDQSLGHVMVLSQSDWPKHRHEFEAVLEKICDKETFQLSNFIHHITTDEILEELALIHNDKKCRFLVGSPDRITNEQQSFEQITAVFIDCINAPSQPIDHIIVDYLVNKRELIVQSLSVEEMSVED